MRISYWVAPRAHRRASRNPVHRLAVDDQGMTTMGTVREWFDQEGWGVIDSPDTPGGCWTHFSNVAVSGYTGLDPGQSVALEWEMAEQDGFSYRAVRTWPADEQPVSDHVDEAGSSDPYRSTLRITFDGRASPDAG